MRDIYELFGRLGVVPVVVLDDADRAIPLARALLEGGVPVIVNGVCIGAVGVSGVKAFEDAQVAKAGVTALTD